MQRVNCENCVAWDINPQDLNQGMCRAELPKVFMVGTAQGPQAVTVFPIMARGESCCQGEEQSPIKLQ